MIKNIVFDLGGVLLKLDRSACISAYNKIGYSGFDQVLSEYHQSGFFLDYEMGKISTEDFRMQIRKKCNSGISDKQIDDAMGEFLIGIPSYKLNYIATLKKKFKIYMLSNTNPVAMSFVYPMFGEENDAVYKYFDKLYLSYELKMAKPNQAVFNFLLNDLNIASSDTLFIDDADLNLESASALGFKTLLINENSDFINEIDKKLKSSFEENGIKWSL